MRERLNNDPKVQLIVFGIAFVGLAILLMTRVMGGGDAAAPTDSAAAGTDPAVTATDSAVPATDPAATDSAATGTDPAAGAAAPATSAPATGGEALLPTDGLPSKVLVAYAKNEAIVLLVIDPKANGSDKLAKATEDLTAKGGVATFIVDSKNVSRYSRITEGVAIEQTPALIVVRPRKLNTDAPTASVSYGIRNAKSVEQALDDALYKGGAVPAYP